MDTIFNNDNDYLVYDEDSMSEPADSSSEDEVDILLQGTPERKLKLSRRRNSSGHGTGKEDEESSEDEFEKEMNRELDDTVAVLEAQRTAGGQNRHKTRSSKKEDKNKSTNSDEVYFDSDEEEMVEGEKSSKKSDAPTDEELLYDPDMDAADQRWMDSRRARYMPAKGKKGVPNSDAVLDCPACMTTLCTDCQRHEVYSNQYRAMFVSNCAVDFKELLKYPKDKGNKKQRKKTWFSDCPDKALDGQTDSSDCDIYHPVHCKECNTLVAMYDTDEVYHFFNVLSSY